MRSLTKVIVLLLLGFLVGSWALKGRPGGGLEGPGERNAFEPRPPAADSAPAVRPAPAPAVAQAPSQPAVPPPAAPVAAAPAAANGAPCLPDFTQLAEKLQDTVVNVSSSSKGGEKDKEKGNGNGGGEGKRKPRGPHGFGMPDDGDDPHDFGNPFERFFGPMPRRRMPQRSLGSGFIFDPEGYILTNNHVVDGADEIQVKLHSGDEVKAQLIGRDPKTDVAVLKIDNKGKPLPYVSFGDSDVLKVGEWVMAIGNPFGLDSSVTAGIVSAKGRFIGQGNYDDFIQTDTPINPGNSGGPLIDMRGKVVGINTSIFSRSGGNIGIGFAIPINLARDLIPDLRSKGHVTRGWLGVMIQKVTPDIAESLGLPAPQGALVADVVKDGPAAAAGIKTGDVITAFDGHVVKESTELPLMVARTPIGRDVEVKILREGKEQSVIVKTAEMKDEESAPEAKEKESEAYGLTVQPLTPEVANNLGIPVDTKGVVVADVEQGSASEEAGLRRGDVIAEVNRQPVSDVESYKKALTDAEGGKSVLLLVRRGENTVFLALKPQSGE
jgi:serine protease Do